MDHNWMATSPLELARQLEAIATRLQADARAIRQAVEEAPRPEPPSVSPQPLLDIKELGEFLGLSRTAIYEMRQRGEGPPFHRFGSRVRYRPEDVAEWLGLMEPATPSPGLL